MAGTIVMIHGMMGGAWCWEKYKDFFEARGYRCITPVLRYHDMDPLGKPDPRLGATSLLDYARDLEEGIANLDEPPVLMGHSMGGLLAQILGSRGVARAMVLLTPAAPADIMSVNYSVFKSFLGMLPQMDFCRKSFRASFQGAVDAMLHRLSPEEQKRVYNRMVYESVRVVFEIGCWFLDFHRAARVDSQKIQCPVLVIAGKEDRITPASVVKKVAGKYKSVATYREFDHTHWMIGEPGWEVTAGYVAGWLSGLPG
ncbi:putative hydrolase or acyltransferase of alpha/beta superfamily [Desulfoscipio gibsoniae DSM 7213]|uniref:Putative hydrolase or acyltransferase of alpha/beta superfamily n=2 Tax=Desulfoscipio gibsoniae TaxID=102134 RepID=R4KFK1_9FIRM|nr:putative hydrolase or acyltransferase of alpha/beta superfamily [Desulfoscipio gibsoniae DSM 7213]